MKSIHLKHWPRRINRYCSPRRDQIACKKTDISVTKLYISLRALQINQCFLVNNKGQRHRFLPFFFFAFRNLHKHSSRNVKNTYKIKHYKSKYRTVGFRPLILFQRSFHEWGCLKKQRFEKKKTVTVTSGEMSSNQYSSPLLSFQ